MELFLNRITIYWLIVILDSYMTTIELEQVIRDYILDIYKKEYTGKIYVKKLDPVGYYI